MVPAAVLALALVGASGCSGPAPDGVGEVLSTPTLTPLRGMAGGSQSGVSTPGPRAPAPAGSPTRAALAGTPASQTYPFAPTTLTLPSGVVAPVDPANVDAARVLQVPADPGRVGWWTGGALAGEPYGSVVLAGHVDTRAYGLGAMAELLDIAPGDEVVVADGARHHAYRVVSVSEVPKARLAADLDVFRQDVGHRLVLVTCGGAYDPASHTYADNVVAVAVPVD